MADDRRYREPFVVADIPGLDLGREPPGLGNRFLQGTSRGRGLGLVLDASEDPEGADAALRAELHAAGLSRKPTLTVLNKVDLLDEELREYLREAFPEAMQVSAKTGEGVEELRDLLEERLREPGRPARRAAGAAGTPRVPPEVGEGAARERWLRRRRRGSRALALKTDWENPEGVERFQRELDRSGVVSALRRAGAQPGDEVVDRETVFDFGEVSA